MPVLPKLDPYHLSLAGTLLAAREAVMAPIRPMLRDAGVTEQQWRVLRVVVDAGSIDASSLAQSALLHAPSVSRILKELADRRLLERITDGTDRRRSIVRSTKTGQALVAGTAVHTVKLLQQYSERFGPARLERLREELSALTQSISDLAPQSPKGGT